MHRPAYLYTTFLVIQGIIYLIAASGVSADAVRDVGYTSLALASGMFIAEWWNNREIKNNS